jgi:hypothetical protein
MTRLDGMRSLDRCTAHRRVSHRGRSTRAAAARADHAPDDLRSRDDDMPLDGVNVGMQGADPCDVIAAAQDAAAHMARAGITPHDPDPAAADTRELARMHGRTRRVTAGASAQGAGSRPSMRGWRLAWFCRPRLAPCSTVCSSTT